MTKSWRCFHCDEVFTSHECARLHFGESVFSQPTCQIDEEAVRRMEKELTIWRMEEHDVQRAMRRMEGEHQAALMRAEESGYAKGLRDGRKL